MPVLIANIIKRASLSVVYSICNLLSRTISGVDNFIPISCVDTSAENGATAYAYGVVNISRLLMSRTNDTLTYPVPEKSFGTVIL